MARCTEQRAREVQSGFIDRPPLVAEELVRMTENDYMPAYYAMLAASVGLVAVLLMPETSQQPLQGSAPTISSDEAEEYGLQPVPAMAALG
jgi:hypothetical protein